MNFENTEIGKKYHDKIIRFMDEKIYPVEHEVLKYSVLNPRELHPIIEELKREAKQEQLWNLFLPKSFGDYSPGLTNAEYAPLAEEMGKVNWASEIFNCNAPDTGNMEVLAKYGSEEQKKQFLKPMLAGEIRSAFLMTEPDVASSDARNIQTSIIREGNEYVINGHKWWSTNARHPHCSFFILMGKNDPTAPAFQQQSMVLIPSSAAGVEIVRDLPVFNHFDYPYCHCEIKLTNVRVPVENIILGEGRGFEIAQGRLGPGRVHHAMRSIGMAQRALEYMCKRANEREAFGKRFSELGNVRQTVANIFCEIQKCRQLTLLTADKIDRVGAKQAKDLIAALKISVIPSVCNIIDDAIQLFGGMGVSNDIPLAGMYTHMRAMRLADGPEEVHAHQLGRNLLKDAQGKNNSGIHYFN